MPCLPCAEDEIQSEEQLLRELEKRRKDAIARRQAEQQARQKQLLEEDRIRREREEALMQKKLDMERRVREMEQALAEKQREKEEENLRKQAEKVARMEAQLRALDSVCSERLFFSFSFLSCCSAVLGGRPRGAPAGADVSRVSDDAEEDEGDGERARSVRLLFFPFFYYHCRTWHKLLLGTNALLHQQLP